ncbi:hypothetical protein D9M70_634430 [compost metagenome]
MDTAEELRAFFKTDLVGDLNGHRAVLRLQLGEGKGRHLVAGRRHLGLISQASTIAAHDQQ